MCARGRNDPHKRPSNVPQKGRLNSGQLCCYVAKHRLRQDYAVVHQ